MKRSARKAPRKVNRLAKKGRKKLVRANAKTAKQRWKARKSAGNGRVQTAARAKGVSPTRKPKQITSAPVRSGGKCGSTKTVNGKPCRNPRVPGRDFCHLHPSSALSSTAPVKRSTGRTSSVVHTSASKVDDTWARKAMAQSREDDRRVEEAKKYDREEAAARARLQREVERQDREAARRAGRS